MNNYKRKLFSGALLCLLVNIHVNAQRLAFPADAVTNPQVLDTAMPALAVQLLPLMHPKEDQWMYLSDLLMVQLTAGKYADAIRTIHTYRNVFSSSDPDMGPIKYIQYEVYANAMLRQQQGEIFENAFRNAFAAALQRLDSRNRFDIDNWFNDDRTATREGFIRMLHTQQDSSSISPESAIQLCRAYSRYQIMPLVIRLATPLLAAENRVHYLIQDSILVKTRDGAEVSAIVVRKKGTVKPLPVIFFFTIYTEPNNLNIAKEAADKGYVGVVANTRGKRLSKSTPIPYELDGRDAWDVTDWISRQQWCNGKIGMYGGSYVGFTQWAAVKQSVHPALKTIVPSAAVVPGFDVPKENDVFLSFVYPWIPYVTNNKFLDNGAYNNLAHWRKLKFNWYFSGAAYHTMDSIDGTPSPVFQEWLKHPAYDTYWQQMTAYGQDFTHINIPILSTTGYYDGAQIGAMYYYREHHRHNPHANHYLVIGPYGHLGCQHVPSPYINGYSIDTVARISIHRLIYQWFDYILRDGKKPALLQDKVNYQVIGTNEWKHAPSLEKMNNDTLTFFLAANQRLLSRQPGKEEHIQQQVDLADRNTGFTNNNILDPAMDTSVNTINGLLFESEPLSADIAINGSFFGQLQAITNKKDMDIGVDLFELLPDGRYFQLSYFLGRASYAASLEKRQLLTPGTTSLIPFSNTRMISKKIHKGSRLVVVININKNPFEQVNYGSGKDVSDETVNDAGAPLQIQWSNRSYVRIPVWK